MRVSVRRMLTAIRMVSSVRTVPVWQVCQGRSIRVYRIDNVRVS